MESKRLHGSCSRNTSNDSVCRLKLVTRREQNMEGHYGSEWLMEEKVKRREMVAPEARYIFVHEVANTNFNEKATMLIEEKTSTGCLENSGPFVGFVHYRFIVEEDIPVLYVYELQLEPRVQGKGLGKFLMQLIELIGHKDCSP